MLLTVIVPVLNEADYITQCLSSILAATDGLDAEILVLDGGSDDGTVEIISTLSQQHQTISVIDNPKKFQVHALNIGIQIAKGTFIVRCDAHSIYPPSYFTDLVNFLRADTDHKIGNVGIPFVTINRANNAFDMGVAYAMGSPIGVGPSHRTKAGLVEPCEVDTLLFGAWRKSTFDEAGLFDEAFVRGQDYEHNLRLRLQGKTVMMIPGNPFEYYTRPNIKKLCRMIFQYAYAKGQIIVKYRTMPNVRSLVPLLAVLSAAPLAATGLLTIPLSLYAALLAIEAAKFSKKNGSIIGALGVIVAIPLMHFAHAAGIIGGLKDALVHNGLQQRMTSTR